MGGDFIAAVHGGGVILLEVKLGFRVALVSHIGIKQIGGGDRGGLRRRTQGDGAVVDFGGVFFPRLSNLFPAQGGGQVFPGGVVPDVGAALEEDHVIAQTRAEDVHVPALTGIVKAPGVQHGGQLPLAQLLVQSAVQGGTGVVGIFVGKIRKDRVIGGFVVAPPAVCCQGFLVILHQRPGGGQAGVPQFFGARHGAVRRHGDGLRPVLRRLGNQQNVADVHQFAAAPGNAGRGIVRLMLRKVGLHLFPGGRDVIAQGGVVHIAPVVQLHAGGQIFHRSPGDVLCQGGNVGKAVLFRQGGQRLGDVAQVLLVQRIEAVIFIVAVEVGRGGLAGHVDLVVLHVGLIGFLRGDALVHALQRQCLGAVPAEKRPFQEILLPAGNAIVNFAGLGVQRLIKVRGSLLRRLTVGGDLHPVIDLKLAVCQLFVSQSGYHGGGVHGIRRIAALAGHVAGVAVPGHRGRDGGLGGLRRGRDGGLLHGGLFPAARQPLQKHDGTQGCCQVSRSVSFHTQIPF